MTTKKLTVKRRQEIGLKIIDIFSEVKGQVREIGGKLAMDRLIINSTPSCRTYACLGGWLANFYKTHTGSCGRSFSTGVAALAKDLKLPTEGHPYTTEDFDNFDCLDPYWHNSFFDSVFTDAFAYLPSTMLTAELDFDTVCDLWIDFGVRLVLDIKRV